MRVLLDTHALLWWLYDDKRMTQSARACIASASNAIMVSAASGWEISTKHRIGKLPEAGDVPGGLRRYIRAARFAELPIALDHAMEAGQLPGPHRDPFDRILIAQARVESLPVVTADRVFRDYGVRVIW